MSNVIEHYWASSQWTWAVADTREEAVSIVRKDLDRNVQRADIITCRVPGLPTTAHYPVRHHLPHGVEIDKVRSYEVSRKKPGGPLTTTPKEG
ncbi:MAG: hypothetical protein WDA12_04910 [Bacilli bacterium]